ncbi:hypothetical protein CQ016_14385 [Arthrobacter sp. MYb222]|nr:hypothetical protein CQ016_14385 [Arthrobacter sp. MYb222]
MRQQTEQEEKAMMESLWQAKRSSGGTSQFQPGATHDAIVVCPGLTGSATQDLAAIDSRTGTGGD